MPMSASGTSPRESTFHPSAEADSRPASQPGREMSAARLRALRLWATCIQDDQALAAGVRALAVTLGNLLGMREQGTDAQLGGLIDEVVADLLAGLAEAGLRP